MMSVKDRNGMVIDKYDYVLYSPAVDEGNVTPDEKAVIARVVSITDGMKHATVNLSFVSLAGNRGRVATLGRIDPTKCLLVAKATGTLVSQAAVLPILGEVR